MICEDLVHSSSSTKVSSTTSSCKDTNSLHQNMWIIFGLFVGFILLSQLQLGNSFILVCYFTNWAQYRPGIGRYLPMQIDPFMCTHLIYAFANMTASNELTNFEWNDEVLFKDFNDLKIKNNNLKTLLALGGWKFGSISFNRMVASSATRATFIESAINYLRKHRFDGLDLDWEYPGAEGNPAGTKGLYTALVQELKIAFTNEARSTGKATLLLTAAVAAGKSHIDTSYDIPEISKHLDFISVMTYDYHGAWESITGHNSPLYHAKNHQGDSATFNVNFTISYWKDQGAPADKLIVGLPTYGRTFKLSSSNSDVGAPASGPGPAGTYSREAGFLANYEICDFLNGATKRWIDDQEVPYAVKGDIWVGYDNLRSIETKARWLIKNKFGGALVWTLDFDDFNNYCKQGSNPILTKLKCQLTENSGFLLGASAVKIFMAVVAIIMTTWY
uniref:acidic mammalian chitinase-like isoform X2 n=1 Tax=Pristiophorus japonicus TaxID=55135 RepID=UPI00398F3BB8